MQLARLTHVRGCRLGRTSGCFASANSRSTWSNIWIVQQSRKQTSATTTSPYLMQDSEWSDCSLIGTPIVAAFELAQNLPTCRGHTQTGRVGSRCHDISCELRPSKTMRLVAASRYCPSEDWLHAMSRGLQASLSIVSQDYTFCLQGGRLSE